MSLVWINCFRRLKLEAQDAAKEEREKTVRQQKERKIKRTEKFAKSPNRKVSFNSIVHVKFFLAFFVASKITYILKFIFS